MTTTETPTEYNFFVGMCLLLAKFALLFLALIFTFYIVKENLDQWTTQEMRNRAHYVLTLGYVAFMALSTVTMTMEVWRRNGGDKIAVPLIFLFAVAIGYPLIQHAYEGYLAHGFDVAAIADSHHARLHGPKDMSLETFALLVSSFIYGATAALATGFGVAFGLMYAYIRILNALFKRLFPRYE